MKKSKKVTINIVPIDPERVQDAWVWQRLAKALLGSLQEDLRACTDWPIETGQYRIHKVGNGIRIENLNPEAA